MMFCANLPLLKLIDLKFKASNDCPPLKISERPELKVASCAGDLLANRRLFEEGDKCILHSYSFIPLETSPQEKLKMIFDAVNAGDSHAVKLLKGQAHGGESWALYGLEKLADAGLKTGKKTLDQIALLRKLVDDHLWKSLSFTRFLEKYLEEAKMFLSKKVVLLFLLSPEHRDAYEEDYLMTCRDIKNPYEYLKGFLDHLFDLFQGVLPEPDDLFGHVKREVSTSLIHFMHCPGTLRLQVSVASFIDKMKSELNLKEESPLALWASEILLRKRDLL